MLKVYNTLSGRKETFEPLLPGKVSMYACGVTVYDYSHLGHARSALVFDVIRNYLEFKGYRVRYVRNFTDVDDKIINRAEKQGTTSEAIAQEYLHAYQEDMQRLGVFPPDVEPKATDHMPAIIAMIERLMAKGHAYQIDGDVYFEVASFPVYGALSKRKAEDLLAGARVEVDARKRNPMDFALWKASKPGEPAWPSPWGSGRPGWHIECSAMSIEHLGETFDIHGGGMDLIFPHHENEIAQSCAATGKEFARYWLHNGFVQINQEKMSKSLGNFFTIREIFEKWRSRYHDEVTAEALRYFLLTTHYRSPLDFSDQGLREAQSALDGFYDVFQRLQEVSGAEGPGTSEAEQVIGRLKSNFGHAMDEDFNTPASIAHLQQFRGEANKLLKSGLSRGGARKLLEAVRKFGAVLRLFQIREWQFNPVSVVPGTGELGIQTKPPRVIQGMPPEEIDQLLTERTEARRQGDFKKADEIRKRLAEHGITIEDKPDGTSRWKR